MTFPLLWRSPTGYSQDVRGVQPWVMECVWRRAPFEALAKRDGEVGVMASLLPSKLEGQRQKHRSGKENDPDPQR